MILFDLKCRHDHVFEAWFKDSATYEEQAASRKIACPICGSRKVTKAPMAPRVAKNGESGGPPAEVNEAMSRYIAGIEEIRRHVEEHCEDVGDRFAEEARKIHYGEVEKRGIYGEATDAEATELADEGVEFHRLPMPPKPKKDA